MNLGCSCSLLILLVAGQTISASSPNEQNEMLMLDPDGEYISREIPLDIRRPLLLYTDGLAEARDGEQLFGEERIANTLRRDPGVDARRAVQVAARGGPRLRQRAASPTTSPSSPSDAT